MEPIGERAPMAGTGRLQVDPLFQGLARPTMILGVSFMYFVINGMFSMVAFINTSNFIVLFIIAPTIHGFGYLLCMREPRGWCGSMTLPTGCATAPPS